MVTRRPKEKRINDITRAAIDVFLEKGYENTTMDAIAKRAGISKGGLYHYFQSKDMVLMRVNQKFSETIEEMMINASQCDSVKEGLLFYMEQYLKYWLEHPKETSFLFLSLAKIMDNPDLLNYYQEFTGDYIKYFEEVFAAGIESGEFIPHDIKTSAVTLAGALDGILSYMVLDENLIVSDVVKSLDKKFIKPIEVE